MAPGVTVSEPGMSILVRFGTKGGREVYLITVRFAIFRLGVVEMLRG